MKITKSLNLRAILVVAVIAGIGLSMPTLAVSNSSEKGWLPLPKGGIPHIAFGSFAKQWQHQPVWEAVIAAQPDLYLFLADAIYADTDGKTCSLS